MDGPVALNVPPEIFLEITAYFHNPIPPYERGSKVSTDNILFGRVKVLRALSQTCLYFRRLFISLAWEHVELHHPSDCTTPYLANVLVRRMTGILKTPSVRRCIRTVAVSLIFSSQNNWNLPTVFVRLLAAASHLTSLDIVGISESQASTLAELLATRSFPSVQTLAIPCSLSRSLSAFPNIHSLCCADNVVSDYYSIALLKASSKHCQSLEALTNFTPSLSVIKCLLKCHPSIKILKFHRVLTSVILSLLGDLQNLYSVQFPYQYRRPDTTLESIRRLEAIFCRSEQESAQIEYSPHVADDGDSEVPPDLVYCCCRIRASSNVPPYSEQN
ncbi:hypothetical protein K438DRAFT_2012456 [Mycena galopus ATCC 62051]|nr:hypothetical protein K438DRAFT_2012456 [Mycena galopus ATCC 62051]